jgi:TonB family protein
MKLNKHEQAKPNVAGLTSQVQQAEIKLILAGMWPPLKPLPVFKYGTDEYRAEIHFDRTRGEWVCRKTSLPSNKVQELRGGLTEMTIELPHGQADLFAEAVAAEPQDQESENEANRRLQAILEWRENYGNGALYSELQDYLSESQQDEIYDSIRMTLTARQLQFNPKNVAFVFDALWNAGGRLATLIEIAQRNKAKREADVHARQGPLPIPAGSHADAGHSVVGTAAEISTGDVPQSLEASFPSEHAKNFAPEPIKTVIPELSKSLTPEPVQSLTPATVENFPTEPIASVSPDRVQTSSPEMIARNAQASEIVEPEILDASALSLIEDLQEKVHHYTPVTSFGPQVRTDRVESSADRIEDSPSHFHVLEISGFQVAAFAFLFAVIGFIVGLTMGRGPLGKRLRDTQKSILAVDATSPALPNRPGETILSISSPPAANTFNTPAVNPPALETEELRPESPSAQSLNARPADSASRVSPIGPSPAVTSRSRIDSDNSSDANKLDDATLSEEKSKENTRDSESFAKVPSIDSNSSPTIESKPSTNPKGSPERNGSTGLIARIASPPASPKPTHSPKAVGPIRNAPRNPDPRRVTPATGAAPHPSPPSAILVSAPAKASKAFRLTFPEKPIAASSSFAMTAQLSVLVSPEPEPALAHKPARLQAGELVSYVWPRYPRPGGRYGSTETVKVRATIGQLGQVLDIKLVSGSISLLPATMSAIRRWRYKPTLLNGRPVQAQQDVTIEFRPPQHLSHVSTHHSSHN